MLFFEGFPSPLLVCSAVLFLPGSFSFFLCLCLSFLSDLCQTLPKKDKSFCPDLLPSEKQRHKYFTIYFCPIFQKTHVRSIRKIKDRPYGHFNFDFNFRNVGAMRSLVFSLKSSAAFLSDLSRQQLFYFGLSCCLLHNKLYFFLSDLRQISFNFSGKKFNFLANIQVIFSL